MFTWIPLYSEIAQKIMTFEGNQAALLEIIRQMEAKGLKVFSTRDKKLFEK